MTGSHFLKVRNATVEDAVVLWEAEAETAKTPGHLVSRPHELRQDAFAQKLRELGPRGSYVVAVDEGEVVVGHAVLDPMPLEALRHVYRLTIVVHPGFTGTGVGTALLCHLQRWAGSAPALRKIELLVRAVNAGAVRFYRRHGFVEEGRFKDHVQLPSGDFVDDIAMAWFPPARVG